MTAVRLDAPVYLVGGSDEVLLRDAARDLIHALVGDLDPAFTVDEIGRDRFQPSDAAEARIAPLVEAAQTPPFLTDRRVVVGRDLDVFTRVEQIAPLVAYLDDPLPTTSLVLVFGPGRLPKLLAEAVARCGGEQLDTGPGRKVAAWVDDQLAAAGLHVDREGTARLVEWLGDDSQKLVGVIGTLVGSFGVGADRRPRPRRHHHCARQAAPHGQRWRPPPAAGDGHAPRPLRPHAAARRRPGPGREGRSSAPRPQGVDVSRAQGAPAGAPVGPRPRRRGGVAAGRGRPRPARRQGVARGAGAGGAGRPAGAAGALTRQRSRYVRGIGRPGDRSRVQNGGSGLGGDLVDLRHQARLAAGGPGLLGDAPCGRPGDALYGEGQLCVGVGG